MEDKSDLKEMLEYLVKKCQELGGLGDGKCMLNNANDAKCQYMANEQTSEYDSKSKRYSYYHKCLLKK